MKNVILENMVVYYPDMKIDYITADQFAEDIDQIIELDSNTNVLLNMSDVKSISSKGIAKLIRIALNLKTADRTLSLCNANDLVTKLITIVKLDKYISIYGTEEEAVDDLSRKTIQV